MHIKGKRAHVFDWLSSIMPVGGFPKSYYDINEVAGSASKYDKAADILSGKLGKRNTVLGNW